MTQRKIKPVSDNLEKQQTYAKNMARYNSAMSQGFYFEALVIDYAMIEDRLRSMLYHMAMLKDRKQIKLWNQTKDKLYVMATFNGTGKPRYSATTLSGKLAIVREAILWATGVTEGYGNDRYLTALKLQIESLDADALLQTMDAIVQWKDYRNEIIHSLLNKNVDSIVEKAAEVALQGMQLARELDAHERLMKKGHTIRRSCGLTTE